MVFGRQSVSFLTLHLLNVAGYDGRSLPMYYMLNMALLALSIFASGDTIRLQKRYKITC